MGGGKAPQAPERHQRRGQAAEAHPGAEAELGGREEGLEDADQAEGRAALGDEVDLVPIRAEEGRDLLERSGSRRNTYTHKFNIQNPNTV